MINFFFDGWEPILRILLVGTLGYIALVMLLRVSGKRTLSQMNGFDFVITVAVGASFGRILTAREVSVVEALVTFSLLMTLQWCAAKLQLKWPAFSRAVTSAPTLLVYRGEVNREAVRRQRFTHDELLGAARKQGFGTLDDVEAMVLEPSGELSVVGVGSAGDGSTFRHIDDTGRED